MTRSLDMPVDVFAAFTPTLEVDVSVSERQVRVLCEIARRMENAICLSAMLRLVSTEHRVFVTTSELSVDLEHAESHR